MDLVKKFSAAVAGSALLVQTFAGLAIATTCTISGNGASSDSTCAFTSTSTTVVEQSNDMDVDNDVDVDADTGDNSLSLNTGGDNTLETGGVDVDISIDTTGNLNSATVVGPSSNNGFDLSIEGNGALSDNVIDVDKTNLVDVIQDNDADVDNDVDVDADTGHNDLEKNTGGDVDVETGNVLVDTKIGTTVNANVATVGAGNNGSATVATIEGNGALSYSLIDVAKLNSVIIDQDNDADVDNDVDIDADTGWNDLEKNTGGSVSLQTGGVGSDVVIDTLANFNSADVSDGFWSGASLLLDGNGAFSDNIADFDVTNTLLGLQDNDLDLDNEDLDIDSLSGWNELDKNTGGDVHALTGVSLNNVSALTTGNANIFGGGVDFDFDLSEIGGFLGALTVLMHL